MLIVQIASRDTTSSEGEARVISIVHYISSSMESDKCPICCIVHGGVTDLPAADEEKALYRAMQLLQMQVCCQEKVERNVVCKNCNTRFCQQCFKNHENIPSFKKEHISGTFKRQFYRCCNCNEMKITTLPEDKVTCDKCHVTMQELTEFPVVFEEAIKKDVCFLGTSCMKLPLRERELKAELVSLDSEYRELLPRLRDTFGIDLPESPSSEVACKMNKVKHKLENIANLTEKMAERIKEFLGLLKEYINKNISALDESYKEKYEAFLNKILEEMSFALKEGPETCPSTNNIEVVFSEVKLPTLTKQEVDVNPQLEEQQTLKQGETGVPVIVATFSLSPSDANRNANFNENENNSDVSSCSSSATAPVLVKKKVPDVFRNIRKRPVIAPARSKTKKPKKDADHLWSPHGAKTKAKISIKRIKTSVGARQMSCLLNTGNLAKRGRGRPRKQTTLVCNQTPTVDVTNTDSGPSTSKSCSETKRKTTNGPTGSGCRKKADKELSKYLEAIAEDQEFLEQMDYQKLLGSEQLPRYTASEQEGCCGICRGGGHLIMCGDKACPKSFHMGLTSDLYKGPKNQSRWNLQPCCHLPQMRTTPPGRWNCFFCLNPKKLKKESVIKKLNKIYFVPGKNDIYENSQEFFIACKFLNELYKIKESLTVRYHLLKAGKPNNNQPLTLNKIGARLLNLSIYSVYKDEIPYTSIEDMLSELQNLMENACDTYRGQEVCQDTKSFKVFIRTYKECLQTYSSLFPEYFSTSYRNWNDLFLEI